jgi:hypothetical protein
MKLALQSVVLISSRISNFIMYLVITNSDKDLRCLPSLNNYNINVSSNYSLSDLYIYIVSININSNISILLNFIQKLAHPHTYSFFFLGWGETESVWYVGH